MSKIVDIQFNNTVYNGLPTFNGVGDTNAFRTGFAEGVIGYPNLNVGGRITGVGTFTLSGNSNRQTPCVQLLEGWGVQPQNPYIDIWLSGDPTNIGSNKTQGAIRAIIQAPVPNGANATFVAGCQTGVQQWHLSAFNGGGWGFQGAGYTPGNPSGGIYRVEIQWDTTQTNWIAARLYLNDGTTVFNSNIAYIGGTSKPINMLRLGDLNGIGGGVTWSFAEIEVWDTRDGDGTFTNQWDNSAGGVFNTSYAGGRRATTYSIPAGFSTPADSVSASYTSALNQNYGNNSRAMDIYIPDGTPPNGNSYPVVFWAHSGFFATGTKSDIISHWRNRLLNAGYAVVSVGYIKSTITSGAYSPWGTSNSDSGNLPGYGRYPSYILDYKLAAVRIRDKFAKDGTSPLLNNLGFGMDGTKLIATGYSAGGYIALGAALSKGLTNDGSSRDLTLAGNSTYRIDELGNDYLGADPTFLGSFVYGAPISMKTVLDNDWTHNLSNAMLWPPYYPTGNPVNQSGAGAVHIASRAFMATNINAADPTGATFTNTDISNIIAQQNIANPANLNLSVGYVRGTADYLVHSAHESTLASAISGTQITYSSFTTPAQHDRLDEVYSLADITTFMDSLLLEEWIPKVIIS